jgi:hypothetical protein
VGIWAVRIVKGDFVWYGTRLGFEEEFVEGANGNGDLPTGVVWHLAKSEELKYLGDAVDMVQGERAR